MGQDTLLDAIPSFGLGAMKSVRDLSQGAS